MPRRSTATRQRLFLQAIERGLTTTAAAAYAGVDRTTPYTWENLDPAFAATWARVRDIRTRQLTDTAMDLALEGDGHMIRFLLTRYDRRAEHQEAATVGEIVIYPISELSQEDRDGSAPASSFITFEAVAPADP